VFVGVVLVLQVSDDEQAGDVVYRSQSAGGGVGGLSIVSATRGGAVFRGPACGTGDGRVDRHTVSSAVLPLKAVAEYTGDSVCSYGVGMVVTLWMDC